MPAKLWQPFSKVPFSSGGFGAIVFFAGINKLPFPPVFAGEKLLKIGCQGRIIANLPVGGG